MIPSSLRVPVPFEYAFPSGALGLAVDAATDFERRDQPDNQVRDKETGERVWTVTLLDLAPQAAKFGRDRVKVKVIAPVQPVLPTSLVPGYPPAVELLDLVLVPYVDSNRCKGTGRCNSRLAYSMRASSVVAAAKTGTGKAA
jgi:hypothetical protein